MAHFDDYNIWTGPVYEYGDLEHDEQVIARGLVTSIEHPEAGAIRTIRSPIRMSGAHAEPLAAPPLLGQHSEEVVRGILGHSAEEFDALVAEAVVATTAAVPVR